jgi:BMFP domain-containing protein YqiC
MILNEKESMSNRLTEIIKQVQNLPPSELNELREVVETRLSKQHQIGLRRW